MKSGIGRPAFWLAGGLGIFGVVLASGPLVLHALELLWHLKSGSWEVVSDKPYIEQYVRSKYEGAAKWDVAFVAGSGRSFSLQTEHRRDSIAEIGLGTISDSGGLRFGTTPLQVAYGELLQSVLRTVGAGLDRRGRQTIGGLVDSIAQSIGINPGYVDPEVYRRANQLLSKRPQTDLLRKALSDYGEYARSRGREFPAFQVGTVPSFDAASAWDAAAVVLPQQGRCLGQATSLGAETDAVEADVAVFPRLVEVNLDRRWMSDALLDSVDAYGGESALQFAPGGNLRLVPARLWVLLPERVTFVVQDAEKEDVVSRWVGDGLCCRIRCESISLTIGSQNLRRDSKGALSGTRSDLPPLLYALISRRRGV